MTRQRLKAIFLYLICTVMLAVQGVPAHAHLDVDHQHGGAQHEHLATIHAHQPVIAHADAIDFGHVVAHLDAVVDLQPSYCANGQWLDHDFTTGSPFQFAAPPARLFRPGSVFGNPLPNRPYPHVGEPRAPPQHA